MWACGAEFWKGSAPRRMQIPTATAPINPEEALDFPSRQPLPYHIRVEKFQLTEIQLTLELTLAMVALVGE
jgi:hypothetical protein